MNIVVLPALYPPSRRGIIVTCRYPLGWGNAVDGAFYIDADVNAKSEAIPRFDHVKNGIFPNGLP